MRVSIIIPTFNRASFLVEAIESALAQDYGDLEVVISDNASTDYTSEVARYFSKDPRVKYFRNAENIGMVKNWHKAVFEYATGEWFLILSDDDILTNPYFVSQAVQLIKSAKDVTVVYSNSYVLDEGLKTLTKLKVPFQTIENGDLVFSKRGTVLPQDFALCNVLFDKKLSEECGAFLNSNNLSCDTELFLRLCLRGRVGIVRGYASIYRVHSGNLLKSASRNIDLVVGSLDSLLKPLMEAQKFHVEAGILRDFVLNSRIKREIFVSLLKTSAMSKEKGSALFLELQSLLRGYDYHLLPSNFVFTIMNVTAVAVTPLFVLRRRALFVLNSLKRLIFGRQVYFELLKQKVYIIE
ncbi:MAG: glycosyltransferase family 2 protein [Pseudobdellovibrionaceae bacterium]